MLDATIRAEPVVREKAMSQDLQRRGKSRHLRRLAGVYANSSIFDVDSPDELRDILTNPPLFQCTDVNICALCLHPSRIRENDPSTGFTPEDSHGRVLST